MMKCAFEVIVAGVGMMFQGHPTGQSKNGIKIMLRAMFWHGHGQFPDIVLSGCDASTVSLKTHLTPLALDLHFEIQEYHCIWLFFCFVGNRDCTSIAANAQNSQPNSLQIDCRLNSSAEIIFNRKACVRVCACGDQFCPLSSLLSAKKSTIAKTGQA